MYIHTEEYLAIKRNEVLVYITTMDEPQKHHTDFLTQF